MRSRVSKALACGGLSQHIQLCILKLNLALRVSGARSRCLAGRRAHMRQLTLVGLVTGIALLFRKRKEAIVRSWNIPPLLPEHACAPRSLAAWEDCPSLAGSTHCLGLRTSSPEEAARKLSLGGGGCFAADNLPHRWSLRDGGCSNGGIGDMRSTAGSAASGSPAGAEVLNSPRPRIQPVPRPPTSLSRGPAHMHRTPCTASLAQALRRRCACHGNILCCHGGVLWCVTMEHQRKAPALPHPAPELREPHLTGTWWWWRPPRCRG